MPESEWRMPAWKHVWWKYPIWIEGEPAFLSWGWREDDNGEKYTYENLSSLKKINTYFCAVLGFVICVCVLYSSETNSTWVIMLTLRYYYVQYIGVCENMNIASPRVGAAILEVHGGRLAAHRIHHVYTSSKPTLPTWPLSAVREKKLFVWLLVRESMLIVWLSATINLQK